MAASSPRRARLAKRLREIRVAIYPTGSGLAEVLGWGQSRVSKIERGAQLPTEDDLRAWLDAIAASDQTRNEIFNLANETYAEDTLMRQAAAREGGLPSVQASIAAAEKQALVLREFQPAMVPALAQTADYARELLAIGGGFGTFVSNRDLDTVIASRMGRQEALYLRNKTVELVLGEAALYFRPGTTQTMLGQLDRLTALATISTATVGVLPFAVPMPALPVCSFRLLDDTAIVESYTSEQQLIDPEDVAVYTNAFDALTNVARTGADAIELIARAADSLR